MSKPRLNDSVQSFETFKTAISYFDDDISDTLDPQHIRTETHKPVEHISKIKIQGSITRENIHEMPGAHPEGWRADMVTSTMKHYGTSMEQVEYWLSSIHNPYASAATYRGHFRSLQPPDANCGREGTHDEGPSQYVNPPEGHHADQRPTSGETLAALRTLYIRVFIK
jgi:hypothetical protein